VSGGPATRVVRGIIHCHSDISYDCKTPLPALCAKLESEGFQFVALTEHDRGVRDETYAQFARRCAEVSSERFLALPGLEVRCPEGVEIAGLGISELVRPGTPEEVVTRIRELAGYAVWVHPWKQGRWQGSFLDCDAVEILNGKVNGTVVPDLRLLRSYRAERQRGRRFHALFGLDLHDWQTPRTVWTECRVPVLSAAALLGALHAGAFVNRVHHGEVSSTGEVTRSAHLRMAVLRMAYRSWNGFLDATPKSIRPLVQRISRPLVKRFKRE
jgi:hypothetical protein